MRCRVITCAMVHDVMCRLSQPPEILWLGVDAASEEKKLNSKDTCSILSALVFGL